MRSRSRTALVAPLLAASFAAPLHAADLFVPGDHPTIQAAIDAAVSGDTIHVAAGTWPGALVIAEKQLILDGEGADVTIVDGLGAAQTLFATSPALDGVEVSDMTIPRTRRRASPSGRRRGGPTRVRSRAGRRAME